MDFTFKFFILKRFHNEYLQTDVFADFRFVFMYLNVSINRTFSESPTMILFFKSLLDPVDMIGNIRIHSWQPLSRTSFRIRDETNDIVREFSIIRNREHQWATWVTSASAFTCFNTSAKNSFTKMNCSCIVADFFVSTSTVLVWDDWNLNFEQYFRCFFTAFFCQSPTFILYRNALIIIPWRP